MKALLLLAAVIGGANADCNVDTAFGTTAGATCGSTSPYVVALSAATACNAVAAGTTANLSCATGFASTTVPTPIGSKCNAGGTAWEPVAADLNVPTTLTCLAACWVQAKYCNATSGAPVAGYNFTGTSAGVGCYVNASSKLTVVCAPGYAPSGSVNSSSSACVSATPATVAGAWNASGENLDFAVSGLGITCVAVPNTSNTTNTSNTSNTSTNVPVPAGSAQVVQDTANAVAACGANPAITCVITALSAIPANTSSANFVNSFNAGLATGYPQTGTAMTAAQGDALVAALPSILTSQGRTISFTTAQVNSMLAAIGSASRGSTAAVVGNRGQCVSNCVALALIAGIRKFTKVCLTNACAGLTRQLPVNGLPVISCSQGNAAQQRDCWKNAACAGQLSGVANCTVQGVAERCPSCDKSKKGLLGLLGLLGIIPLVLSSLLLSLLLLCIRRKKTAGAVQFATYDAGAQNVCVPGAPGFGPGYPATCL